MIAVFKRDICSYFRTMTGYVLIAFLIVMTGIYFMVYNMYQGYPYFSYTLASVMVIMLIWVPVLTMRSFAEERKAKTDQLLFTSPLRISQVVVGKYLAMISMLAVPAVFFCIFPLIIKAGGTAYLMTDYVAIFEFFLVGCAFIALGMLFSSLTESPMIAAVSTFGVIFLVFLWENLVGYLPGSAEANVCIMFILCFVLAAWIYYLTKNRFLTGLVAVAAAAGNIIAIIINYEVYENLFADVLGRFNLVGAFDNAVSNSVFDLPGTILPLTVIGVCIFMTIQSIEKRRWS